MTPKFKYNQRVKIIRGFYEGYDALLNDFRIKEKIVYSNNSFISNSTVESVQYSATLLLPGKKGLVCAQVGMDKIWLDEALLEIKSGE